MATVTQQWAAPATLVTGVLTTQMDSLASAALSAASTAFDNRTVRAEYINFKLHLASLTPTGTPQVSIWLFKSIDGGTIYDDVSLAASHCLRASVGVTTGAGAKEASAENILIGPHMYKVAVQNQTNVAFASSGNTLDYSLHKEESV